MDHPYPLGARILSIRGEQDEGDDGEGNPIGTIRETGPNAIGRVVNNDNQPNPPPQGWTYGVVFPNGTWVFIDQGDGLDDPEKYQVYPPPEVSKFLTVSGSHLPEAYADQLLETVFDAGGSAAAFCGFYGSMLWAPEDPDEHDFGDMPESVRDILIYARKELGCTHVMFDQDGEVLDGFATYNDIEG